MGDYLLHLIAFNTESDGSRWLQSMILWFIFLPHPPNILGTTFIQKNLAENVDYCFPSFECRKVMQTSCYE